MIAVLRVTSISDPSRTMTSDSPASLRKRLRQARCALSPRQQEIAAHRLYHRVSSQRFFRFARRIAFYLATDGEIDPALLLADALSRGVQCYLPCMHPHRPRSLLFLRYREGDTLVPHRWGMQEPSLRRAKPLPARFLDLVFVPLVGFDASGNRLGMGKGIYDRTFWFRTRAGRNLPRLVGLAHECQRVERVENQAWDVAMDRIESDHDSYRL